MLDSLRIKLSKVSDNVLTYFDQLLFAQKDSVDSDTIPFFQFRPLPQGIKRAEINDWIALQTKILNPYKNAYHYFYLSKHGLHIWFSQTKFTGIPETTLQTSVYSGEHLYKGQKYLYKQKWYQGVMIECVVLDGTNLDEKQDIKTLTFSAPWAYERQLIQHVKRPVTWFFMLSISLACVICWYITSLFTLHIYNNKTVAQIEELGDNVNDKLEQINKLTLQAQSLNQLMDWRSQYSYFPNAFGSVANIMLENGSWNAKNIQWQNSVLELEFITEQIDLASLIKELETISDIENVNIRPHNAQYTWLLEAEFK